MAFYRLPRKHHKHLKSTNMLERYNQEIKRRTHIVRVFPNSESVLRSCSQVLAFLDVELELGSFLSGLGERSGRAAPKIAMASARAFQD